MNKLNCIDDLGTTLVSVLEVMMSINDNNDEESVDPYGSAYHIIF